LGDLRVGGWKTMLIITIWKYEGNCAKAGPKLSYRRMWGKRRNTSR
jgi:hypothetical protein